MLHTSLQRARAWPLVASAGFRKLGIQQAFSQIHPACDACIDLSFGYLLSDEHRVSATQVVLAMMLMLA